MTRDPAKYFDGMNLYAYVNNQPTYFVDPMGLWASKWDNPITNVHNKIIDKALKGILTERQIDQIKQATHYADSSPYQSPEYSYMHAMRSPTQTVEQARDDWERFITSNMQEAAKRIAVGQEDEGYFKFGMALHAVMDSTAPDHRGFQVWHGEDACYDSASGAWECLKHGAQDLNVFDPGFDRAVRLVREKERELSDLVRSLTRYNNKRKEPSTTLSARRRSDASQSQRSYDEL